MLQRLLLELGPWNWMVLGFALLVAEILAPGVLLVWIGIAALLIGAASLMLWDTAFWTWQVQVLAFLGLSLVSAYAGKRFFGSRRESSDQPLLNRRGEQMIGRTATSAVPRRCTSRSAKAAAASSSATRCGGSLDLTCQPVRAFG